MEQCSRGAEHAPPPLVLFGRWNRSLQLQRLLTLQALQRGEITGLSRSRAERIGSSRNPLQDSTGFLKEAQGDELILKIDADPQPVDATIVRGHHPADPGAAWR